MDDASKLLKARLAAGEAASYDEVYDLFGPALFRTALRVLGRHADAEDAVQEVFAGMVRSRDRMTDVRNLKAYLFASLRHEIARALRDRERHAAVALDEANVPAASARGDNPGELWRLAGRLPVHEREVLALKMHGGLTFREIGEVCNVSPNTAASRYRYALEKLRDMLEKKG